MSGNGQAFRLMAQENLAGSVIVRKEFFHVLKERCFR